MVNLKRTAIVHRKGMVQVSNTVSGFGSHAPDMKYINLIVLSLEPLTVHNFSVIFLNKFLMSCQGHLSLLHVSVKLGYSHLTVLGRVSVSIYGKKKI